MQKYFDAAEKNKRGFGECTTSPTEMKPGSDLAERHFKNSSDMSETHTMLFECRLRVEKTASH